MTTDEVDEIIKYLRKHENFISRYDKSQMKRLKVIWERTAGSIDYEATLKAIKKKTGGYESNYSVTAFVLMTVREALQIFSDYPLKIGFHQGFVWCGKVTEHTVEEMEEQCRLFYKDRKFDWIEREVEEIYPSILDNQLIIIGGGEHVKGKFWDANEYEEWKNGGFKCQSTE